MTALVVTLALALSAADGGAPTASGPSLLAPFPLATKNAPAADRSYELHRATDGTGDLVYEAPGFTARIARDGTARFVDKHFTLLRPWSLLPFAPTPTPRGRATLQSTLEDLLARRSPRRGARDDPRADPPVEPPPLTPRMSPYRPDPKEACLYPRPCYFEAGIVVVGLSGTLDLTDALMRLAGEDPYRREKAHFLAATSELRGALAARAAAENVRRAATALPARLEAIACDASRSPRERRAIIEALRREMDGDTPASRDAVAAIQRFLETRFDDADGGVRCAPAP
jgi:hypothetical protein